MDKEEFLEKANNANAEAIGQSKLSDMLNKDSSFYQGLNVPNMNVPPQASAPVQTPVKRDDIPRIKTFNADVSEAVENNDLSMSRIALAEAKRNNEKEDTIQKQKPDTVSIVLVTLGIMLIAGGLAVVSFVVYTKFKPAKPISTPIQTETPTLIRFDQTTPIDTKQLTGNNIIELISKEIKNPPKQDLVRRLKLTTTANDSDEVLDIFKTLELIEARIPEELSRTLQSEFYIGVNFISGAGFPFLIIEGEGYESLFPGLLMWESTLQDDIKGLLGINVKSKGKFEDIVLSNRDGRAILDEQGLPIMFYTIIDEKIALFATTQTTLDEILKRIREKKLEK